MPMPFIGEVRITSFNSAPDGWAFCNGQTLLIATHKALYSVIGNTFGGDGQTNFCLPNFQGATPLCSGTGFPRGATGGLAAVTLATNQIPSHTHRAFASAVPQAESPHPEGNLLAAGNQNAYAASSNGKMNEGTIASSGGDAHGNMPPYLVLNYIIALQGILPTPDASPAGQDNPDPYLGEIRMFTCPFVPHGFAMCDGQLRSISQESALFSLLGTTFGGDGKKTFAVPNLQGRFSVGSGQGSGLSNRVAGATGGVKSVTLTDAKMPAHTHDMLCVEDRGDSNDPVGNAFGIAGVGFSVKNMYSMNVDTLSPMAIGMVSSTGAATPAAHENMPPYQVLYYFIATSGKFPPRP